MDIVQLILNITLLILWCRSAVLASEAPVTKPNCTSHCGTVTQIPFPFGIGTGCYLDDWFEITCENLTNPPKPYLKRTGLEVTEISIEGTLKTRSPITFSKHCNNKTSNRQPPNLKGSPFLFSQNNRFTAMGCNIGAAMTVDGIGQQSKPIGVCYPFCVEPSGDTPGFNTAEYNINRTCGLGCCQTKVVGLKAFNTSFEPLKGAVHRNECSYAFLVDQNWFKSTDTSAIAEQDYVPVVLEWKLDEYRGYFNNMWDYLSPSRSCKEDDTLNGCLCAKGYQGNPYLVNGCIDIDECANHPSICLAGTKCVNDDGGYHCSVNKMSTLKGLALGFGALLLITAAWFGYKLIKKRNELIRKEKFFKRNGGLLLEQQLSSGEVNVEKIKLFKSTELKKSTDNFNVNRILGQGGQGTVYKGMLADGRIVAVKKSKIVDEGQVSEFINEVVILSQINHRNVVKILGCCLETEVPLLVYEFIPNGTLYQYIQGEIEEFQLTWKMRLRIASEISGALSYLHSAASFPIFHRDIKSTNILLDEKYRAKVADFGTSRSIVIGQTHLTTAVHGTFGYLDPEYFRSSQFTEKSDVYSFGVVLVELLTGEKHISLVKSSTQERSYRSLAAYFITSMEEDRLLNVVDALVLKEGSEIEIRVVANLAIRCLNLNGSKRPTMREVTAELEAILLQMPEKSSNTEQNYEVVEFVENSPIEHWDAVSS